MQTTDDPTRVTWHGRAHWLYPNGTLLPVISGGAVDDPDKDDVDDEDDTPKVDHEAEAKKWKTHARKHEAEAKKLRDRVKELDDADKSEIEKASGRAAEAEKRAEDAELRALRLEIAAEKGLTASAAKRLHGSTREELEADADDLAELIKPAADTDSGTSSKGTPTTKPTETLKGGGQPNKTPVEKDPRKLAELIGRQ